MRPLRITAQLAEPVVYYGDGMHLDGLVALGYYRLMSREEREALPPIASPVAVDFDLPLERWECGGTWGWKASAVHADWLSEGMAEVRKKPEAGRMVRWTSAPSLQIDGGPLKAKDLKFPTRFAKSLTWYSVGDEERIRRSLAEAPGIGKLCGHGHGVVMSWRVEPWHSDWSIERDGALTRRMPAAYRPDQLPGRGGIRPPYHHRSRIVECVDPAFEELRP